ncbi:SKP1-like protein 1A [Tripterygium wilfordii]|uniref:SKP1-like protein 1A n=1 Tax=Tripterygium wilfordii TaxID=458696 RepID=UPI0018F844DE|nr:SKP1-like protein 1A [Tripterygium wilfordii]
MPTSMKKVILTSLEGERFELDEKVAMEMRTIQRLIDVKRELAMTTTTTTSSVDDFVYAPIEVSKVSSAILSKVIDYCQKQAHNKYELSESLRSFDADLVDVSENTLFDFMVAADCLGILNLLDLTMAQICRGKSKNEISNFFYYLFN